MQYNLVVGVFKYRFVFVGFGYIVCIVIVVWCIVIVHFGGAFFSLWIVELN